MKLTPGLALLGVLLILAAIPFAFSLAPLVIGIILLVVAARRGHRELAVNEATFAA